MQRTDATPRATEPAGQKPIDFDELTARCMGRLDLAQRVLARFCQTAEAEMQSLQAAADRSDRNAIEQIAHRVAGTALNVSAGPLAGRCQRLEFEVASGEGGPCGELAELVAETIAACREAMDSITSVYGTGFDTTPSRFAAGEKL